jgi:hypothetical protein
MPNAFDVFQTRWSDVFFRNLPPPRRRLALRSDGRVRDTPKRLIRGF